MKFSEKFQTRKSEKMSSYLQDEEYPESLAMVLSLIFNINHQLSKFYQKILINTSIQSPLIEERKNLKIKTFILFYFDRTVMLAVQ